MRCDRCNNPGVAYTVTFDAEGTREFILCDKHNGPLEKLRSVEYGEWKDQKPKRRRGIQKIDPKDIPKA